MSEELIPKEPEQMVAMIISLRSQIAYYKPLARCPSKKCKQLAAHAKTRLDKLREGTGVSYKVAVRPMWMDFWAFFEVDSYKDTTLDNYELAVEFIQTWKSGWLEKKKGSIATPIASAPFKTIHRHLNSF